MENKTKIKIWIILLVATIGIAGGVAIFSGNKVKLFKGTIGVIPSSEQNCDQLARNACIAAAPRCIWRGSSSPSDEMNPEAGTCTSTTANLVVNLTPSQSSAVVGNTVTFNSTIQNTGNGPSEELLPQIFFSRDGTEFPATPDTNPAAVLNSGQTRNISWPIEIVPAHVGTWEIWVCAKNRENCSARITNFTVSAEGTAETPSPSGSATGDTSGGSATDDARTAGGGSTGNAVMQLGIATGIQEEELDSSPISPDFVAADDGVAAVDTGSLIATAEQTSPPASYSISVLRLEPVTTNLPVGTPVEFYSRITNNGGTAGSISPIIHFLKDGVDFPSPHSPPTLSLNVGSSSTASWDITPLPTQLGQWEVWICATSDRCTPHKQITVVPASSGPPSSNFLTISTPTVAGSSSTWNVPREGTTTIVAAFKFTNTGTQAVGIKSIKLTKTGSTTSDTDELSNDKLRDLQFLVDLTGAPDMDPGFFNLPRDLIPHNAVPLQIAADKTVQWNVQTSMGNYFPVLPGTTAKLYVIGTILPDTAGKRFRLSINPNHIEYYASPGVTAVTTAPLTGVQSSVFLLNSPASTPPTAADLIIQSLTNPGSLSQGSTTLFTGIVKNIGSTTSALTQARFCVDNESCLTTGTGQVGSNTITINPLSENATVPVTATAAWGATTVGAHTATLCANIGATPVTEALMTNNCSSQTFMVTATQEQPSSIALVRDANSPSGTVNIGTQAYIAALLNFTNNSSSAKTINSITLTVNGSANSSDIANFSLYDGTTQLGTTIAALSGMTLTFQNLSWPITPGQTKTLTIKSDVLSGATANRTFSIGVVNNSHVTISGGATLTGTLPVAGNNITIVSSSSGTPQRPDLITQSLTLSTPSAVLGTAITFTGTINNIGAFAANNFKARFCVDNPNCLSTNTGLVNQTPVSSLTAGASTTVTSTSWTSTLGNHTAYFCADVTTVNEETNESNNCTSQVFVVNSAPSVGQTPPLSSNGTSTGTTSQSSVTTCEQQGRYTYTGPARPGVRMPGMCIDCPTTVYETNGGSCTVAAATPAASSLGLQVNDASQFAQPQPTQASTLNPFNFAARGAAPNLNASQRLIRAPERGNTGPGVIVYFGIWAAVNAGIWLKKRKRNK